MSRTLRAVSLSLAVLAAGCNNGTGACTPETDLAFCSRLVRECGEVVGFDTCGTSRTVVCGMCDAPEVCGATMPNRCGLPTETDASVTPDAGSDAPVDAGPAHPHWLDVSFTITTNLEDVNGMPYTHAFDSVVGVPITLRLEFDDETNSSPGSVVMPRSETACGPAFASTTSAAHPLTSLVTEVEGLETTLVYTAFTPTTRMTAVSWTAIGPETAEFFSVEVNCTYTNDVAPGADGNPVPGPFTCADANVALRRFAGTSSNMTDYASGAGVFEHH